MDEIFRENLQLLFEDLAHTRMPFGRYGPEAMPPDGAPLYDLPWEYLHWFAERGFPKGRLGELMEMVYHIKGDGADEVFAPLRRQAGGRHSLRAARNRPGQEESHGSPESKD